MEPTFYVSRVIFPYKFDRMEYTFHVCTVVGIVVHMRQSILGQKCRFVGYILVRNTRWYIYVTRSWYRIG